LKQNGFIGTDEEEIWVLLWYGCIGLKQGPACLIISNFGMTPPIYVELLESETNNAIVSPEDIVDMRSPANFLWNINYID
jgi:hypothetical protein